MLTQIDPFFHNIGQERIVHYILHGERSRRTDGICTESRGVGAGHEDIPAFLIGHYAAHRQAAGDSFGESNRVRQYTVLLEAEQAAGTADTCLDFVHEEQPVMDDSLSETADGLDKLNGARASIHAQTGSVYSSIDASLIGLNTVASQLSPIAGHLTTASKGVSDINDSLTALTGNLVALSPALEQTRDDML